MNKYTMVTPDQAAVIRQYIAGCEVTDMKVSNYADLLTKLGYKLIAPDIRVAFGTQVRIPFGQRAEDHYKDEYHADWEAFTNSEIESNASTSVTPEGDPVGNLLREEV